MAADADVESTITQVVVSNITVQSQYLDSCYSEGRFFGRYLKYLRMGQKSVRSDLIRARN